MIKKDKKIKAWAVALRGRIQMFWDDNLAFEIFYNPSGAIKCAQRYSEKYGKKYKAVPIVMYKIDHKK